MNFLLPDVMASVTEEIREGRTQEEVEMVQEERKERDGLG
jgi:hypothetical protein